MKPSLRLQQGFRAAIADRAVAIGYSAYAEAPGNVDSFTLEVADHSDAYHAEVSIPALLDTMPGRVIREKFGLDTLGGSQGHGGDAILLTVAVAEFDVHSITPKVGDKVVIPSDTRPWYVMGKPDYDQQVYDKHIGVALMCTRKASFDDRSPDR